MEESFPAPTRIRGRLFFDRDEVENYKRAVRGLDPIERDPSTPIQFVKAQQVSDELKICRRTLGRHVQGLVRGVWPVGR